MSNKNKTVQNLRFSSYLDFKIFSFLAQRKKKKKSYIFFCSRDKKKIEIGAIQ